MRGNAPLQRSGRALLAVLTAAVAIGFTPTGAAEQPNHEVARALERSIAAAAARVRPAVVTLEVTAREPAAAESEWDIVEPFARGQGSGLVLDAAGYILTNEHVVAGATEIEVIWRDGRRAQARLVGRDEPSDVALLRLVAPPPGLSIAELGDSDAVQIGQFAIAIGSPLGLQDSVSVGHLSATSRRRIGHVGDSVQPEFATLLHQDFLQVDTPIHAGSSGGPLVDIEGRVIGINTAILGAGGGGLGFAIPINLARGVAAQLRESGRVRRAWLGIEVEDAGPGISEAFGTVGGGVRVTAVLDGSPAAAVGLQAGDVLLRVGGHIVETPEALGTVLSRRKPGDTIPLEVLRDGGAGTAPEILQATATERPDQRYERQAQGPQGAPRDGDAEGWLDSVLGLDVDHNGRGRRGKQVVDHIGRDSAAERAGLIPGDIILEVDLRPVSTASDIRAAVEECTRRYVPVLVDRQGKTWPLALPRP